MKLVIDGCNGISGINKVVLEFVARPESIRFFIVLIVALV